MMTSRLKGFGILVLALVATACGGGNGGGGSSPAVASGPVQAFGSIVVNGVRYDVVGGELVMDDNQRVTIGSDDQLRGLVPQGAVVTVTGRRNDDNRTGSAARIEFKSIIEGAVTGKDDAGFTVAGLRVNVDASTRFFDGAGGASTFAALQNATRVEVSGAAQSGTALLASMVRAKSGGQLTETEAKGYVVGFTAASAPFGLSLVSGGAPYLQVNAAGVTVPAGVGNGSLVEVKGSFAGGTLTATLPVEIEDRLFGNENDEAEVEGVITAGASIASFQIGDRAVTTNAGTRFEGVPDGSSGAAEFRLGIKVEAEGRIQGGTLVADKVKFKDGIRLGGLANGLLAQFTLLGKTVVTDGATQLEGAAFPGGYVEVRGTVRPNGQIYAQEIRVRANDDEPFVQGVVEAKSAAAPESVTILGTPYSLAGTELQRDGTGDDDGSDVRLTNRADFYGAITDGRTMVKVKWRQGQGPPAAAKEAEIESEDD
jgi:hypothetical protein